MIEESQDKKQKGMIIIGAGTPGVTAAVIASTTNSKETATSFLRASEVYLQQYIEIEPLHRLDTFREKEFICKGKHQYREVKGVWMCQCGQELK